MTLRLFNDLSILRCYMTLWYTQNTFFVWNSNACVAYNSSLKCLLQYAQSQFCRRQSTGAPIPVPWYKFDPPGDRNLFNSKQQGSIAHNLLLSPFHHSYMTKILLKKMKQELSEDNGACLKGACFS